MVPNPAPNFSFLGFSSYPQWLRSPRDFTTAKRKYDDSATQQLPSSRRRSIRFSAPIIHSQSHDSGTAYNSLAPPVDEIEIAKQKAQEIAARLFNGAEAKRSKFENGGGFDSNDSKGFGSAPTFAVAASRDMGYILFMIKMQNQLDLIKLNSLSFVHKQDGSNTTRWRFLKALKYA